MCRFLHFSSHLIYGSGLIGAGLTREILANPFDGAQDKLGILMNLKGLLYPVDIVINSVFIEKQAQRG